MSNVVMTAEMLQGLVNGARGQEVSRGARLTKDSKFPIFPTPVNKDVMVYIPRTNVIASENGEEFMTLDFWGHTLTSGTSYSTTRCLSGLTGNQYYDALGYDGTCKACEAMSEVWELYNKKMEAEAGRLGVQVGNDPNDQLKPAREKLLREMAIKNAEEYVIFPIVVIPTKAPYTPADDAMETMEVYFVHWRRQRYEESILKVLSSQMNPPQHPAGLLWYWQFTYTPKAGQQPNARDSARNAKYHLVVDPNALSVFQPFFQQAEELAKDFTVLKAAEVIVAAEFKTMEDHVKVVDSTMKQTRTMLDLANAQGGGVNTLGTGQPTMGLPGGNPLAQFGQVPQQPQQGTNGGQQPMQGSNAGVGQPMQGTTQKQPQQTQPYQQANFGQQQQFGVEADGQQPTGQGAPQGVGQQPNSQPMGQPSGQPEGNPVGEQQAPTGQPIGQGAPQGVGQQPNPQGAGQQGFTLGQGGSPITVN